MLSIVGEILHRSSLFEYVLKNILFIDFQREGKGRRKNERNINVWLPLMCSLLETCPTTQACSLTGNQTGDPLVHRLALNPLSHTSQGRIFNNQMTIGPAVSKQHNSRTSTDFRLFTIVTWTTPGPFVLCQVGSNSSRLLSDSHSFMLPSAQNLRAWVRSSWKLIH